MQITHKKGEMCKNRLIIKECPYFVPPKISIVIKKTSEGRNVSEESKLICDRKILSSEIIKN